MVIHNSISNAIFKVYKIDNDVEKENNENNYYGNSFDQNKILFNFKTIHKFIVTDDFITQDERREYSSFFNTINDSSECKLVLHVDNESNYLYFVPSKEILLLNDKNVWEEFQNY